MLDGLAGALNRTLSLPGRSRDALVDALLRAGELECALADHNSPDASCAAELTNLAAAALVELPGSGLALAKAPALLETMAAPASLNISPPEGFAYYALHPLDFAAIADQLPLPGRQAAIV